ncbi:putative Ecdysone-induced protein 78C [Hypsibius exemplaris]|uniref:Ecdysone-induced protein 78C n=1 Tax=Hypsibius exemplaris TaxID=2072580 RepID=A0A1W0X6K8_HYPEX|nr:putative Ecdysone-induced protein 78C [Hypsibius exemplaris]
MPEDSNVDMEETTLWPLPTPNLCKVCNGTSTGVHYGVQSCEGCKAFFKRAICQYGQSKCYFGGTCLITPETRGRCKACRLQKCLSEGMALDGTKVGRGRGLRNFRAQGSTPSGSPSSSTSVMTPFHSSAGPIRTTSPAGSPAKSIISRPPGADQGHDFIERGCFATAGKPLIIMQPFEHLRRGIPHNVIVNVNNSNTTRDSSCISVKEDEDAVNDREAPKSPQTLGVCLDKIMERELIVHRNATAAQRNAGRFSFMSSYLALLAERNKRLEDTVSGVTEAVAFTYRGQIEDWSHFMARSLSENDDIVLKPDTTIDNLIVTLQASIVNDTELLVEFCRHLPGFSELSRREQARRLSAKFTTAWLLNRAPYVRNRELFSVIGKHHYGRYWMETLLDSQFVRLLFDFMESVNELNLSLTENYLLMAVICLQPSPHLCDPDSIQYVKFLYSHYLDALMHIFSTRHSGNFIQLRSVLMQALAIDALHLRYVSLLDFSRSPIRPVNGIEYSPTLCEVKDDRQPLSDL